MDYRILLIIGVAVGIIVVIGSIYEATKKSEKASNELKYANGEITLFQYCAHLGKDAIDEPDCKEFNLRYGPQ